MSTLALNVSAAVKPIDKNNDNNAQAFQDLSTGLYWSDANVFGNVSVSVAQNRVSSASFEEITNWRLPTVTEFMSLYSTQGHIANGSMIAAPFTGVQNLWYWTADVDPTNMNRQTAYSPGANAINFYSRTLSGNSPFTWAVATVPEPETVALFVIGLAFLAARSKKSRSHWRMSSDA